MLRIYMISQDLPVFRNPISGITDICSHTHILCERCSFELRSTAYVLTHWDFFPASNPIQISIKTRYLQRLLLSKSYISHVFQENVLYHLYHFISFKYIDFLSYYKTLQKWQKGNSNESILPFYSTWKTGFPKTNMLFAEKICSEFTVRC